MQVRCLTFARLSPFSPGSSEQGGATTLQMFKKKKKRLKGSLPEQVQQT